MVQMIPTAAYLERYVFELRDPGGDAQIRHAVTLARRAGGAEVVVDGVVVAEGWEVADGWEAVVIELAKGACDRESGRSRGC